MCWLQLFSIGTDLKYLQEAVNGGNAAAKKEVGIH